MDQIPDSVRQAIDARTDAIFSLRKKTTKAKSPRGFAQFSSTTKIEGVCKVKKRMAPQVGLEPTTLRLTAGRIIGCPLILKGLTTARRRQNRYAWWV